MIFKSFWYGPSLSSLEWLCLKSFTDHDHDIHLYAYDDGLDVPNGVYLKDASLLYPEEDLFFYQDHPGSGAVSAFTNMFRYRLLYEEGGWWIDMDVAYSGEQLPEGRRYYGWQDGQTINCATMKFEQESDVMRRCLETAEQLGSDISWGQAGPDLLTSTLERLNLTKHAAPSSYAYPVPWHKALSFYQPSESSDLKARFQESEAPFIHLWNGTLSKAGIQREIAPPQGSFLAFLANDLDVKWSSSDTRYSPEAIEQIATHFRRSRKVKSIQSTLNSIKKSRTWKVAQRLQQVVSMIRPQRT